MSPTCTVTSQSTAFSCSLTAGPADCLNVQHTVLPTVLYMALLQFAHTIKTVKFTVRTAKDAVRVVAERFKGWGCGCLPAGIVGSNVTGAMDVCLFECCHLEVSATS